MQGQADQNRPPLTWKKLIVQIKWGTKRHGCLQTASKTKNRSACCPVSMGPE